MCSPAEIATSPPPPPSAQFSSVCVILLYWFVCMLLMLSLPLPSSLVCTCVQVASRNILVSFLGYGHQITLRGRPHPSFYMPVFWGCHTLKYFRPREHGVWSPGVTDTPSDKPHTSVPHTVAFCQSWDARALRTPGESPASVLL